MKIQDIKNKVISETEALRKSASRASTLSGFTMLMSVILGFVGGCAIAIKLGEDFVPWVFFCVVGAVVGLFVGVIATNMFADSDELKEQADQKAKTISIDILLAMFSRALSKLVKDEKTLLLFEKNMGEIMKKKDVSWFNDEGELKYHWNFGAKSLECQIQDKKCYLAVVYLDQELSSTNKTVVAFDCGIVENGDNTVQQLIHKTYLVALE